MKKDPLIFIEHILENIEDIENFIRNVTKEDFLKNKEKQNAVIRSIEVIGEATKNLPLNIRLNYPNTPWKDISGTRDKLSHHYFGVDLNLIWKTIVEKIPTLKEDIIKIRASLGTLS